MLSPHVPTIKYFFALKHDGNTFRAKARKVSQKEEKLFIDNQSSLKSFSSNFLGPALHKSHIRRSVP